WRAAAELGRTATVVVDAPGPPTAALARAGVRVLARVDLDFATRPVDELESQVRRWARDPATGVRGVFLDQAPTSPFSFGPVARALHGGAPPRCTHRPALPATTASGLHLRGELGGVPALGRRRLLPRRRSPRPLGAGGRAGRGVGVAARAGRLGAGHRPVPAGAVRRGPRLAAGAAPGPARSAEPPAVGAPVSQPPAPAGSGRSSIRSICSDSTGREKRYPWARWQLSWRSASACSGVSIPSATTVNPWLRPSSVIARAKDQSSGPNAGPGAMKDLSILSRSTGNRAR